MACHFSVCTKTALFMKQVRKIINYCHRRLFLLKTICLLLYDACTELIMHLFHVLRVPYEKKLCTWDMLIEV